MQTQLSPEFQNSAEGRDAEAILRKCVHCGFCNATCPTYQLLGDELDGPRGRIYLMKQVFEGATPTRTTQLHLDRCLTCRNCETTCPSGVEYGRLVEIGRRVVDERVQRPVGQAALRWVLREGLASSAFAPAMKMAQALRPLLPRALQDKVPTASPAGAQRWPQRPHPRKVLLLLGCVQPAMRPNINSATARVLDIAGIQTLVADGAGCCGAIRLHNGDPNGALDDMRRNIDAWWPLVDGLTEQGSVEAIVMNASGCGVTVKDYGHALAHDPSYAAKARRVAALTVDVSELLPEIVRVVGARVRNVMAKAASSVSSASPIAVTSSAQKADAGPDLRPSAGRSGLAPRPPFRLAFHSPCTLQHGQHLRGGIETHLRALGFDVHIAPHESHLCCGSAGTYSVLQPELADALRDRKLGNLGALQPEVIASANIGCIQHLQSGTATPVRHWIEILDEALA